MKTRTAIGGLLLVLFALALNGCAGMRKTRCSCPNFRGSRAIYGKADFKIQNSKFKNSEEKVVDLQFATFDL
ncbi:MAG: hypothetical protein LBU92_05840 [Prevotellaceae bacterium]|jgi:hypothetical protein|nr:hypothetical protein [Prevotellaceae bacterium]